MGEIEQPEANVRSYLQVLSRRWLWVFAVTVLCLSVAAAYIVVQKKRYSASAQLLAQPASGTVPLGGTQQTVSPTDVLTYLTLATGAPVKAEVATKLGFSANITASQVGQTDVINLKATAKSPALAALIANTYAHTFVNYQRTNAIKALTAAEEQYQSQINAINYQVQALQSQPSTAANSSTISTLVSQEGVLKGDLAALQVAGSVTSGGVELVGLASPPSSPSSPKPLLDGGIALTIGLILGIAAASAAEYFDDKVYTKEAAEKLTGGLPVLALIPKISGQKKRKRRATSVAKLDPFSPATEAYRSLRTSLHFAGYYRELKTILVTSPARNDGKTLTVANLAVVLATAGERVVVVGCDLRRPRIEAFFGQPGSSGFTSVLLGQKELRDVLQPVADTPGLTLLSSGPVPPNPTELLGSDRAAVAFHRLGIDFDVVLIDSPPLLPVADALVLSGHADGVLLIVTAGQTKREEVERAAELLGQADARPIGIVLNKVMRRSDNAYRYRYRYHYAPPQPTPKASMNGNDFKPAELKPRRRRSAEFVDEGVPGRT